MAILFRVAEITKIPKTGKKNQLKRIPKNQSKELAKIQLHRFPESKNAFPQNPFFANPPSIGTNLAGCSFLLATRWPGFGELKCQRVTSAALKTLRLLHRLEKELTGGVLVLFFNLPSFSFSLFLFLSFFFPFLSFFFSFSFLP